MRRPGVQNALGTHAGARRTIPSPASMARSIPDAVAVTFSYAPSAMWVPLTFSFQRLRTERRPRCRIEIVVQ
jgi:hypothetical protein